MAEPRTYHGGAAPHDVLAESDVEAVMDATFQLMAEVGVKFDPKSRAMEVFSGSSCSISSEGIVRFPRDLVQQSIDSAGRTFKLWDRSGTDWIEFDEGKKVATVKELPKVDSVPFPLETKANEAEIAEIFTVPLLAFSDVRMAEDREVTINGQTRILRIYHVAGGRQVWGLTARLIQNLLERLGMGGMPE